MYIRKEDKTMLIPSGRLRFCLSTLVKCEKNELRVCLLTMFLCGMCYKLTVTVFQDDFLLQNQTAYVRSVLLSVETTSMSLENDKEIVDFGETSNASHLNRYSYGTARSNSKSLVSYTDKTIRQTSKSVTMVRSTTRVI